MFKDEETEALVSVLLETYSIEELLEHSDLSVAQAIAILVDEGYIVLPEVLPIDKPF